MSSFPWPCGSQVTFAVTAAPDSNASRRPSRTCGGPPMRERKGDWRRPGIRRAGETKTMRKAGWGRTRRYYTCAVSWVGEGRGFRVGEMVRFGRRRVASPKARRKRESRGSCPFLHRRRRRCRALCAYASVFVLGGCDFLYN